MRNFYALFLALLVSFSATAQNDTLRNSVGLDTTVNETITWSSSTNYFLDGYVFVEEGDTLIIEPGTVIRGLEEPTDGSQTGSDTTRDDASALIVAQGGYIKAEGTLAEPIIFTSDADVDLNDITDVTAFQNNLWGGVIILGKACLNTDPGVQQIEGIPSFETRARYGEDSDGNCDDADDSGIFKYVSIRHGGNLLGQDNEINGLTLGAVGSKTVIEYVEVFANQDDGFEWFGGTVNGKYLVSAFVGDDGFDYDQGFRGKGQFWFTIQRNEGGGEGGEFDGGTGPEDGMPFATPQIVNATFIGPGPGEGDRIMRIRDNAGGFFHNNIYTDFGRGVAIEIRNGATEYSARRAQTGDLALKNNLFFGIGGGSDLTAASRGEAANFADADSVAEEAAAVEAERIMDSILVAGNNLYVDPAFKSVDSIARANDASQSLDPRPTANEAFTDLDMGVYDSTYFDAVSYKGAFSPNGNEFWVTGWTAMELYGFINPAITSVKERNFVSAEVFPNPTEGLVEVRVSDIKVSEVQIFTFDINGRILSNEMLSPVAGAIEQQVNISEQPAGVYFVTVKAGDTAQTFKVVKQ